MAVLSFPRFNVCVSVCVHSLCGSNPDLEVGSISNIASTSLSPATVHLWEDSIPDLPNDFLSSLPKFFLWHWHQSEGKRSTVRLLNQSVHVSANSIRNVLWPLTLTSSICLTSTWVCICADNITRECWIKALLQVKSEFFKKAVFLKTFWSCCWLIIFPPHWLGELLLWCLRMSLSFC